MFVCNYVCNLSPPERLDRFDGCPTKGIATNGIATNGIATNGIATNGIGYKWYRLQMVSATNGIGNKRYRHKWYRHKWYRLSKLIQVTIIIEFLFSKLIFYISLQKK